MANLLSAMDALFWDMDMSSPHIMDGCAKGIPGDPLGGDGCRPGKALRIQQLSILRRGFPLGMVPNISPTPFQKEKDLGSCTLQSVLLRPSIAHWWVGLVGQVRPTKLIANLKKEAAKTVVDGEFELPELRDVAEAAKHFLDKSLYALALYTHIPITSSTSLIFNTEAHAQREGRRKKLLLYHKLPFHDITFNAAWPELFIDSKHNYWNVPESMSLDCSSVIISNHGLRYRFGVHKNAGQPHPVADSINREGEVPAALLPGVCAKAAVAYEKTQELWRQRETADDLIIQRGRNQFWRPAYDVRLKEPHASISTIIGGTLGAWLHNDHKLASEADSKGVSRKRSPVFADLFGSWCYTFQHGKFRKRFGDLSRVDARVDISSASAFAKNISNIFRHTSTDHQDNSASLPRLSLIIQQQILGPIVFRVDTKCVVDAPWKSGLQIEDFMYSLTYSLRLLQSGKVVAWYSPKRKEGMVELRMYEF